ncbi:myb-like protein D [Microplitis mediator]|uniref:myb-like protein D n=1 Tax=Microplitis mediator TaxID=375433 RepID=UPI0025531695|nr:myb-like protein D [Microplitis mediator]
MAPKSVLSVIAVALVIADVNSYVTKSKKVVGFSETPWYSQSTYQQPNYNGDDSTGSVSHNNDNNDNYYGGQFGSGLDSNDLENNENGDDSTGSVSRNNNNNDNNYGGQSGFGLDSNDLENNKNEDYPEYWVVTSPDFNHAKTIDKAASILIDPYIKRSWKITPYNFNPDSRKLYNYVVRLPNVWWPESHQQSQHFTKNGGQGVIFLAADTSRDGSNHQYTNARYSTTYVAPTTLEVDYSTPVILLLHPDGHFGLVVKVRPARSRNAGTNFRPRYWSR